MNAFIARTALVPSSKSHMSYDGYCGLQVGDDYGGAHADGFDYADYQADQLEWSKMIWDVAGTPHEGYLFLAAARDYAEYRERAGDKALPRGKWCEAHVAGQIDRALEIAGDI